MPIAVPAVDPLLLHLHQQDAADETPGCPDEEELTAEAPKLKLASDQAPPRQRRKRVKKPTHDELLTQWIQEGRPDKILADMLENEYLYPYRSTGLSAMDQAIAAAADQGIDRLTEVGFQEMLVFTNKLLMRMHYLAGRKAQRLDNAIDSNAGIDLDHELNEQYLPAVQSLHQHLVELVAAYGRAQHSRALGREKPKSKPRQGKEADRHVA